MSNKSKLHFERMLIMGIINTTPDSFSDGGKYTNIQNSLSRALEMIHEKIDIIDIGGESSRPGATKISTKKELERTIPLIKKIRRRSQIQISIDSYKPEIAEAAIKEGANIINDITGLTDPKMIKVARDHKVPVIIMHMHGNPQNMQKNPLGVNDFNTVLSFLEKQAKLAKKNKIPQIILDPGIGFGKTAELNIKIINNIDKIKKIGHPVLIGASRKSFIQKFTNAPVTDRLGGTIATQTIAQQHGANIIRVHDFKEAKQAAIITEKILNA